MEDIEMINLSFLSRDDVSHLENKIGFTDNEKYILEQLVADNYNDDGIMLHLALSRNKYYDTKMRVLYKIIRSATEN